ncbi:putative ribonuclease H protein [Sesamum alatum]|uniref:Ribonuclease H protein n=1 Tax=Sesamum alatum TaxID=300844 RepID=A0AAE2CUJ9_9LAMI|nr:putative ribonuclease H protein [Sesamum alatum]
MTRPDSPLSQILKARYFPRCTFWEVPIGTRPSLTWRSLLAVREVLREGCEERVGTDSPLETRLMWRPSKKGTFSVRSAYDTSLAITQRSAPSPSRPFPLLAEGCEGFWKWLWAAHVSARIWVQIWKFCSEAALTMENLARRNPSVETKCVMCDAGVESMKHILLECPFTNVVWALSNLPWRVIDSWNAGAAAWFSATLRQFGQVDGPRFLTLCWALWRNRNRRRMESIVWDPIRVVQEADQFLAHYQAARARVCVNLSSSH